MTKCYHKAALHHVFNDPLYFLGKTLQMMNYTGQTFRRSHYPLNKVEPCATEASQD